MGRLNRIYILPTGFGAVFIAGALLMILVGASYQNNLVNMLAFFMMSLIFIAMVQTHNNLKDISLEQISAEGGFAGDEFLVTAVLSNKAADTRYNLETRLRRLRPKVAYENVHPLLPKGQLKLRTSYVAPERGLYRLRDVNVSAVFPLGLFRAWLILPGETHVYIYPHAHGQRTPRGRIETIEMSGSLSVRGGDDFFGHRRYQVGDSPGHIDWRARAKKRPLLVKEFDQGAPQPIVFDWNDLEGLGIEERLSQLAAWINEAGARRDAYGLRLPGVFIPANHGLSHLRRCLEALAVFGQNGVRDVA